MKHKIVVDLLQELRYRRRMEVKHVYFSTSMHSCYPICPACDVPMEREYQNYCDRCGQCLGWRDFDRSVMIRK